MRLSITRQVANGAFLHTVAVDSAELSPDRARELEDLVRRSELTSPGEPTDPGTGAADSLAVVAELPGRRHTVVATEATASPELRALLEWLRGAPERQERVEPAGG